MSIFMCECCGGSVEAEEHREDRVRLEEAGDLRCHTCYMQCGPEADSCSWTTTEEGDMSPPPNTRRSRRCYVPWKEFHRSAVAEYVRNGGECWPVQACEQLIGDRVRIVIQSDECGTIAIFAAGIDDDGRPFIRRLDNHYELERAA